MPYGTLNADTITNSNGLSGNAIGPGFKNRIINGDMRIDQRNAGASVTLTSGGNFSVDRFQGFEDTDGAMTAQQDSSAPAGFINSVKLTTTTADSSLSASQYALFRQMVEGTNVADLAWGTASAKTVTLSFWVRSSLTGTFGGALGNSAFNRSYPFTYSISVANTWEYKTVTIAGDTSGTWLTTTGTGIRVNFGLGVGSDYNGTAGAWAGAGYLSATGATSVIGTLNATFYITGVQLEVAPSATSFDYRPYGTELMLCQRYYYEFDASGGNLSAIPCWTQTANNTNCRMIVPVTMRTALTASYSGTIGDSTQDWSVYNDGDFRTITAINISGQTNQSFRMQMTVSSGIAARDAAGLYALNTDGGAKLRASAEL